MVLTGIIAASIILTRGEQSGRRRSEELTTARKEETTDDERDTTERQERAEKKGTMVVHGLGYLYYLNPDAEQTFKERLTEFVEAGEVQAGSARVLEDHEDDRDDEKEPAVFYLMLDDVKGTIIEVSFDKTSGRYGFAVSGPGNQHDISDDEDREEGRTEHEIPESSEDEDVKKVPVSITDLDGDLGRAADMEDLKAALTEYLRSIDEGRRNFIVSSVGTTEKGYEAVLAFETVRHDGRNVEVSYDGSYHFRLV